MNSIILNGLLLGWSVAWPPGPINTEMIRRGIMPASAGGGFWTAWKIGLGACTGDFIWALAVSAGAGAFLNRNSVRLVLGLVSFVLLLFLAFTFARAALREARLHRAAPEDGVPQRRGRGRTYLLGFFFALTSPWNIGFWLAVVGGQSTLVSHPSLLNSVALAACVVLGAMAWGVVLCTALRLGARFFAHPAWQIGTQALSALVMLWFAVNLATRLFR